MRKYYFFVEAFVAIVTFIMLGKNVTPTRVDMEYLEVAELIRI